MAEYSYSSDDEIAWGPLTLREIRKEFEKEPRKINRRETDYGHTTFFTPSTTFTLEKSSETDNKTVGSGTSAYFTPNESLQSSEQGLSKNDVFLDKLTKVIEGENIHTPKTKNDTLLNILEANSGGCGGLENIQQTLIEETFEEGEGVDRSSTSSNLQLESTIETISDDESESENENVVVISSEDSDVQTEIPIEQEPAYVKIKKDVEEAEHDKIMPEGELFTDSVSPDLSCLLSQVNFNPTGGGLENSQQTPIEEEEEEVVDTEAQLESTIETISDDESESENENVIIINSDDSIISDVQTEAPIEQEPPYIKIEKDTEETEHEKVMAGGKSLNDSVSSDLSCLLSQENFNPAEDSVESENSMKDEDNQLNNIEKSNTSKENDLFTEEENCEDAFDRHSLSLIEESIEHSGNDAVNVSGVTYLSLEHAKCEENNSDMRGASFKHEHNFDFPEPSNTHDDSLKFNDTMEEMEMALKQGLNYVMPEDDILPYKTPESTKFDSQHIQKSTGIPRLKKKTPSKFDYIHSPIGDYIRKKSPSHDLFKLPLKPVKSKLPLNNMKSPQVQPKAFKNIVSPVLIYIKNSPGACLKQNIPVKTIPSLKLSGPPEFLYENKENSVHFPEVVYKPAKKVIVTAGAKDIVLPTSIKKMVHEPVITTHEVRIRGNNQSGISKKLLAEDLTVMDSTLLNQSEQDISIINVKQAFIK